MQTDIPVCVRAFEQRTSVEHIQVLKADVLDSNIISSHFISVILPFINWA